MEYIDKVLDSDISLDNDVAKDLLLNENLRILPAKLYKYRACNQFGFEALEQDYLWADNPASFLDPMDSIVRHRLRYELAGIRKWLETHIGEIIYYYIEPVGMKKKKGDLELDYFLNVQKNFLDENGEYKSSLAKKAMALEINKLSIENKNKLNAALSKMEEKEFKEEFEKRISALISEFINEFKESVIVACLTEDKNNFKMWEDYADKYAGFCVEYTINQSAIDDEVKDVIINLFKIKYYKRIPGVNMLPFIEWSFKNEIYGINDEPVEEYKKLIKQLIYKRFEYNGEREWRIILDEETPCKVPFPFITAVYAGYKMNANNLKKLKAICKKKKIPLFLQSINNITNSIEYERICCKN